MKLVVALATLALLAVTSSAMAAQRVPVHQPLWNSTDLGFLNGCAGPRGSFGAWAYGSGPEAAAYAVLYSAQTGAFSANVSSVPFWFTPSACRSFYGGNVMVVTSFSGEGLDGGIYVTKGGQTTMYVGSAVFNLLYVAYGNGNDIFADDSAIYNASSGEALWQWPVVSRPNQMYTGCSAPAAEYQGVLATFVDVAKNGTVYAMGFDAWTGAQVWNATAVSVQHPYGNANAMGFGAAYYYTSATHLVALSLATGSTLWTLNLTTYVVNVSQPSLQLLHADTHSLVLWVSSGSSVAVQLLSVSREGSVQWTRWVNTTSAPQFAPLQPSSTNQQGAFYLCGTRGEVLALQRQTGDLLWTSPAGVCTYLTVTDVAVVVQQPVDSEQVTTAFGL